MSFKSKKSFKCPTCCPDVEVEFRRGSTTDEKGNFAWAWECPNCGHTKIIRKRKPKAQAVTKAQQAWLDELEANGWKVSKTEFIRERLWVQAKDESRSYVIGNMLAGFIGPHGSFKVTLHRLYGDAKVEGQVGFRCYLLSKENSAKELERTQVFLKKMKVVWEDED